MQERLDVPITRLANRNANTDRQSPTGCFGVGDVSIKHPQAHTFPHLQRLLDGAAWQEHRELLATGARQNIIGMQQRTAPANRRNALSPAR